MTILIANIGTSDLTVKIADCFLPVGFARDEPNENQDSLTEEEKVIWKERLNIVAEKLCPELGVTVYTKDNRSSFNFRALTEKLWQAYEQEPDRWHDRLYLGRILGSIDRAIAMGATKGYIFVSDQKPKPHVQDTIYLFQILQKWLQKERPKFEVLAEVIPETVNLIDSDALLNFYYYKFIELSRVSTNSQLELNNLKIGQIVSGRVSGFQDYGMFLALPNNIKGLIPISKVSKEYMTRAKLEAKYYIGERIQAQITKIKDDGNLEFSTRDLDVMLVSIKGGTPQMVEALKLQAMSVASTQRLFLIDTQANIHRILSGLASECRLTAHWRYMRSQKYETVNQLLGRWDFDGAIAVLRNWQDYLDSLIAERVIDFEDVKNNLASLIPVIKCLEIARAYFNLDIRTVENIVTDHPFDNETFKPEKILADYKHRQQNRVLHMFTLCRIYWQLDQMFSFLSGVFSCCDVAIENLISRYCNKKQFSCFDAENSYLDLPKAREQLGNIFWQKFVELEVNDQNPRGYELTEARYTKYRLASRYNKRNFVEALIYASNNERSMQDWEQLKSNFIKLDFWGNKRNKFVHSAKGVSKDLMVMEYEYAESQKELDNCHPDEILTVIEDICRSGLLSIERSDYARFTSGADADCYIYSEIRDWVGQRLANDI